MEQGQDEDAIAYPPRPPRAPGAWRPWLLCLSAAGVLLAAVSWFAWDWLAPDVCLDSGGSFDYRAWQCTHAASQPYVDVPLSARVSTWGLLLGTGLALALVSSAVRDVRRRG